jgi:hypothetical protein
MNIIVVYNNCVNGILSYIMIVYSIYSIVYVRHAFDPSRQSKACGGWLLCIKTENKCFTTSPLSWMYARSNKEETKVVVVASQPKNVQEYRAGWVDGTEQSM